MDFKSKIRAIREEKGLSQVELGDHLNKSRFVIGNWERGVTLPNVEELKLISDFFNIDISELTSAAEYVSTQADYVLDAVSGYFEDMSKSDVEIDMMLRSIMDIYIERKNK